MIDFVGGNTVKCRAPFALGGLRTAGNEDGPPGWIRDLEQSLVDQNLMNFKITFERKNFTW